jgi:hypothetical protein
VYLVGDPVQLPATVISSTALEQGYDVSLFKRLQVCVRVHVRVCVCVRGRMHGMSMLCDTILPVCVTPAQHMHHVTPTLHTRTLP